MGHTNNHHHCKENWNPSTWATASQEWRRTLISLFFRTAPKSFPSSLRKAPHAAFPSCCDSFEVKWTFEPMIDQVGRSSGLSTFHGDFQETCHAAAGRGDWLHTSEPDTPGMDGLLARHASQFFFPSDLQFPHLKAGKVVIPALCDYYEY